MFFADPTTTVGTTFAMAAPSATASYYGTAAAPVGQAIFATSAMPIPTPFRAAPAPTTNFVYAASQTLPFVNSNQLTMVDPLMTSTQHVYHHHGFPAPTAALPSFPTPPMANLTHQAPFGIPPVGAVTSPAKLSPASDTYYMATPASLSPSLMQWPAAATPTAPFIPPTAMMMSIPSFNVSLTEPDAISDSTTPTPPNEVRFSSSKQKRSNKPLEIPPPAPGQTERMQLVIHYLAPEITDAGLCQLFAGLEGFTHARVATESGTGRSRGFGYVWFQSQESAMNAIDETNGRVLMRKRVRVVFAAPQSLPW